MHQNYPNPFNPETIIRYSIPNAETSYSSSLHVVLKIYDMLGKEVATLVDAYQQPGTYKINFNGQRANNNGQLASGVYFYVLHAGNYIDVKKMLFIK